jgi:hypothetical protein
MFESADDQAAILDMKATDMGLAFLVNDKWTFFVLVLAHPC